MQTEEIKKLLKGSTAVLILDNGEPSFVILGYDSYKNLLFDQEKEVKINHSANSRETDGNGEHLRYLPKSETGVPNVVSLQSGLPASSGSARFQNRLNEKEAELLEKINKEILALKNEIDKEEKGTGID